MNREELRVILTSRHRALALCSIVAFLAASPILTACQSSGGGGVVPNARYRITEPFKDSLSADLIGLRVRSDLATGSLSAEQISQLSTFLSVLLDRSGQYLAVIDLTSSKNTRAVLRIVDVGVTEFLPASQQQLAAGQPSKLSDVIWVTRTEGTRGSAGAASIWATGHRLKVVGKTEPPDTVKEFAEAIRELVK